MAADSTLFPYHTASGVLGSGVDFVSKNLCLFYPCLRFPGGSAGGLSLFCQLGTLSGQRSDYTEDIAQRVTSYHLEWWGR